MKGKIVTGDAIFCQKSIAAKIVERGGDYVFPVKDNQKTLRQDIETAFNSRFFPLCSWNSGVEKAHGRRCAGYDRYLALQIAHWNSSWSPLDPHQGIFVEI